MTEAIFFIFSIVLIAAAFGVIASKNPVHAALYLVLSFFTGAVLWMLIKAEFLAVSLVVIYVGAVMVLFIFVVMMLDINFEELRKGFWQYVPVAGTVAAIMAVEMVMVLMHRAAAIDGAKLPDPAPGYNNAKVLGELIYTQYFLPFQLAAVILLVGMIAAIALTLRKRKNTKYINPAVQIKVKRDDRLRIVSVPVEARPSVEPPKADDGEQQA
ncbi:NADH-quinone oxidoreductase subunit J [Andreprevotia chitinilytica]|uniref:NADH-quinone oxidoreductase subunit J n=1 Tax=Andreprevotia chitinilytica TaxID=396808 RepID=UPI0005594131|nr:NADH-quinone oxidoreductase subunit J [Andreprevotia chitinilytica]